MLGLQYDISMGLRSGNNLIRPGEGWIRTLGTPQKRYRYPPPVRPTFRFRERDRKFKSVSLQRGVCLSSALRGCRRKAPHFGGGLRWRQNQLRAAGCANRNIYREKVTGARADRRELLRMLDHLALGHVATVTRIDRLARSYDRFKAVSIDRAQRDPFAHSRPRKTSRQKSRTGTYPLDFIHWGHSALRVRKPNQCSKPMHIFPNLFQFYAYLKGHVR